eukprot:m.120266 g.120266  ORF g.120266 m.120266 type:complete len:694 (+) comp15491_c0_seq3:120-2201(+)
MTSAFTSEEQQLAFELLSGQLGLEAAVETIERNDAKAFHAVYKGAEPIAAATIGSTLWSIIGGQVVANTVKKLKQRKEEERRVIITISLSGLKMEDDQEVLAFETLRTIQHVYLDPSDAKRVAYVSHYSRLGLFYCHIIKFREKASATNFLAHMTHLRTKQSRQYLYGLGSATVVDDDDLDDDEQGTKQVRNEEFGFEDEGEQATGIRQKIESLFGATLAIAELDYLCSEPLSQVELAEAYKEDCDHLQFIIDTHISKLEKQGSAKALTRKKSSIRRVKKRQSRHVILIASMEGVRVVDSRSKEEFLYHYIKDVKLWGHVIFGKEDRAFAFVSCDAHLQSISCHMFFTRSAQDAKNLAANVGKAVDACKEVDDLQAGQPFMPVARTKGQLTGRLARMEVDRADIKNIRAIGAGQFGIVFEVEQTIEGFDQPQIRAVKALRQGATKLSMIDFVREAEILAELSHHNIVRLEGVCLQQQPWLLVEELVPYGDLDYILRVGMERHVHIRPAEVLLYATQILNGLGYLLEKRFLHLDVAARNMLLGNRNEVKIADFGMCRRLPEGKTSLLVKELPKVATRWLAIEAFDEHKLSEKSDVWAFAVTVWEIIQMGQKPYEEVHFLQVPREVRQGLRPKRPETCSDKLWDILAPCWHKRPERRPTFKELSQQLETLQASLLEPIDRDLGREIFTRTVGRTL